MLRGRRLTEAMSYFEQTHTLATELNDRMWEAVAVGNLANVCCELDRFEDARRHVQRALALYRELGDPGGEGDVLRCASQIHRGMGNLGEAAEAIQEALDIARERNNRAWEAWWLVELGRVQLVRELPEDALESLHRAATLQLRLGDQTRAAVAWDATGEAYRAIGRYQEAIDFHRRAVSVHSRHGEQWLLAVTLDNLATALDQTGAATEARRHWTDAGQALIGFTDPAARRLRDRVGRLSAGPES